MIRSDGRQPDTLRPVKIIRPYLRHAEGSVMIEVGHTRVLCVATVEEKVPSFLKGGGRGWVTAEYAMLPRATPVRNPREAAKGKIGGRTYEIQRLIGRALRSVVDFEALGERTVLLDCDVIQADGGTRTAAITGAYLALVDALQGLKENGVVEKLAVNDFLAATSVGLVEGEVLLDLAFDEDSRAEVDMNVVMTGSGRLVELQGTAEGKPFTRSEMEHMLDLAARGISRLIEIQKEVLGDLALVIGGNP